MPGCTTLIAAPCRSVGGTFASIAAWAAFWSFELSVVMMVSPPLARTASRSEGVLPNVGSDFSTVST